MRDMLKVASLAVLESLSVREERAEQRGGERGTDAVKVILRAWATGIVVHSINTILLTSGESRSTPFQHLML